MGVNEAQTPGDAIRAAVVARTGVTAFWGLLRTISVEMDRIDQKSVLVGGTGEKEKEEKRKT